MTLRGPIFILAGLLACSPLAQAADEHHEAEAKKPELVGFYLGTLTETCVNCHAQHAQAKFPAFAAGEASHGHAH